MSQSQLIVPMTAQVLWVAILYAALTIVRAPVAWGIGAKPDGTNPWAAIEPRISANLKNQFEWPVLFYVVCLVAMRESAPVSESMVWFAWVFILGRLAHSTVQILTTNIRLRGVVFTINFVAVLLMWGNVALQHLSI